MNKPIKSLVNAAVLSILATGAAHSAGFSLYGESNGASTGNVAAGIAAEASDASTGWYNPAGLVLVKNQQAVFGGVGIFPVSKMSGRSVFATPGAPSYVQTFNDIQSAENAFVPSFHYALPLGDSATFGLSVVSPFGLATDWGPSSPVRYSATYTEFLSTTVSPEIAGKLTDNFSVGAGLDLQWARVKFNQMLGAPTAGFINGNPMLLDSFSFNKGDSYGVGFHVGVMGMFNDNHSRLGLNYQSRVNHRFHGFSRLSGQLASPPVLPGFAPNVFVPDSLANGVFENPGLFSNNINLPDVVTLSAYHDLNDRFALLGSVVYTGWGVLKNLQLNNAAAASISGLPAPGTITNVSINSTSSQNYRDTWRASLGANYHVNEKLMLRTGAGYDQTPTNDVDRDVRLPDADRWTVAVGARYQMSPAIGFDAGYSYIWAKNKALVNKSAALGTSSYTVQSLSDTTASLVGLQLNWTIDPTPPAPMK